MLDKIVRREEIIVLREGKRLSSRIFLSPNKMMSENFELY